MTHITAEGIVESQGQVPEEAQVESARKWLREMTHVSPRINRNRTSYGWKHVAEKYTGNYISNGALIQAALLENLKVQHAKGTPNAFINIKERT